MGFVAASRHVPPDVGCHLVHQQFAGGHALKLTVSSADRSSSASAAVLDDAKPTTTPCIPERGRDLGDRREGLTLAALTSGLTRYTGLELGAGAVTLHGLDSAFPLYISNVDAVVGNWSSI